jgi:hypothetical protein
VEGLYTRNKSELPHWEVRAHGTMATSPSNEFHARVDEHVVFSGGKQNLNGRVDNGSASSARCAWDRLLFTYGTFNATTTTLTFFAGSKIRYTFEDSVNAMRRSVSASLIRSRSISPGVKSLDREQPLPLHQARLRYRATHTRKS